MKMGERSFISGAVLGIYWENHVALTPGLQNSTLGTLIELNNLK